MHESLLCCILVPQWNPNPELEWFPLTACAEESQTWALLEMNSLRGRQALGRVGVCINIKAKAAHGYIWLIWYDLLQTFKPNIKSSIWIRDHGINWIHSLDFDSVGEKTHFKRNDLMSESSYPEYSWIWFREEQYKLSWSPAPSSCDWQLNLDQEM